MNNTHRVCDVFVTIPVLGTVSRDESGAIVKHGGKCRVHVYAVKKGQALTDGLMVGSTVFSGYTESPYRRKIKVIVPDGHSLMALRIGEDDLPLSWDSLPLAIAGEVPITTLNEPAQLADCFHVINGMIFIVDEFILSACEQKKDKFQEWAESLMPLLEDVKFPQSSGEVTNTVTINTGVNNANFSEYSEIINKHLREALKPGGILRERR